MKQRSIVVICDQEEKDVIKSGILGLLRKVVGLMSQMTFKA